MILSTFIKFWGHFVYNRKAWLWERRRVCILCLSVFLIGSWSWFCGYSFSVEKVEPQNRWLLHFLKRTENLPSFQPPFSEGSSSKHQIFMWYVSFGVSVHDVFNPFFFDSLDSTPESLERMHDLLAHRLKLTGWWFRNPKKNHWGCKNPGSQWDRPPINWWISKNHQQHDHMTLLRPAEGKKRNVQDWRFNHSCHEWLEIVSFLCKANLKMYQRMKNGSILKRRTTDSLYLEGVFLCQLKNTESLRLGEIEAEKLRRKTDLVVQLTRLTQE